MRRCASKRVSRPTSCSYDTLGNSVRMRSWAFDTRVRRSAARGRRRRFYAMGPRSSFNVHEQEKRDPLDGNSLLENAMELECGVCVLRTWRESDAAPITRHANDRDVWLNLRDRFPHPYRTADAVAYIRSVASQQLLDCRRR